MIVRVFQIVRIDHSRRGGKLHATPAAGFHQAWCQDVSGRRELANARKNKGNRQTHDKEVWAVTWLTVRHIQHRVGVVVMRTWHRLARRICYACQKQVVFEMVADIW